MPIISIKQPYNYRRISLNSACKLKCYISKSKLVLSECNDLYFIAIAFIAFTLHDIKQCPVFFGTPGRRRGNVASAVIFIHQNDNRIVEIDLKNK